ncbi:MAG: hypothetical protein R3B40_06535 [Polyangiales bacterium]|nr:hypothetical protein [Myxococcales bacterium]MCB9657588.1 hypothetical protein [Sandaracinaceae bacterium]
MSAGVGLWLGGALLALFFAWILGHMQRTDARLRTERVLKLTQRGLGELVPGEVNATRGALRARAEPLTCPVDGAACVFYELSLTRAGSVRGQARAPETVQHTERYADAVVRDGDAAVGVALRGARFTGHVREITREATFRDGEWLADTWEDGGWSGDERAFVDALGDGARGELDAGTLTLRLRTLPPVDDALVIGEALRSSSAAEGLTLGSSARFQLELTSGSLAHYQRAQQHALTTMQGASRAFVALAVVLALLAGLTYAGVLG